MDQVNTQWHMGFNSALDLEFREDRSHLSYYRDYTLNQQALEIDLLIIRKDEKRCIVNEIGRLFRKYNIVEYKSPMGQLNVDTFYKTTGYACLYKAYGSFVDERQADEMTVTLVREGKPVKLFQYFADRGIAVEHPYKGIYYIMGETLFPTQIIVTRELDTGEHKWLTALSGSVPKQQLKALLHQARAFDSKIDKELADAVLEITIKANMQVAEELREEDNDMGQALRALMAPEIELIKETVREETRLYVTQEVTRADIKKAIEALRMCGQNEDSIKSVMKATFNIPEDEMEVYLTGN